jgi:DNA-binding CsgD family transcriptional regulator
MAGVARNRSRPPDRAAVERTAHDLILGMIQQRTPPGVSVLVEGAAGVGKTFLARRILDAIPPGAAKAVVLAGERGRRNDPFAGARPLLAGWPGDGDPGAAAFDRVDELCADGPVVLWADDAHNLDAATLTLLRRLVWASQSLPLAVLVTTRPDPAREPLRVLVEQAQVRLSLPPMGPMMLERLVYDRMGRWPGPRLRSILGVAAGNPLFAAELLRAYHRAGALADADPDLIEARFELDLHRTGVEEMIRVQLAELDDLARAALAAMAVWGTDIDAGDLASLAADPDGALDEALDRILSSGLARRDPAGTVRFTHDLFREVTYDELAEPERRALHRRAAEILTAAGYRPSLVADHLLRAAGTKADPALATALQEAVAASRGYAPEVTADLLGDVAAVGAEVAEPLLVEHAAALFRQGRGEAAEMLIRERVRTVTDPAVAAQLQVILIRSLLNRADTTTALTAIERTMAITGLPAAAVRQLEWTRAWLLTLDGQPPPDAELDAMLARSAAAGDTVTQSALLATAACAAFLARRPDRALELIRASEDLIADAGRIRPISSTLFLPATFELASSGPAAASAALDHARRLAAERESPWVGPFLGFTAGAIAFTAGDWDDAVAELDSALERAEETGTGWISQPVGFRCYIDAHRGATGAARARLDAFRHRGLPLQYGNDRPGWAELAVLEAEGAARPAATLARRLWAEARVHSGFWSADLAPDVTRIALAGMDRQLVGQIGDEVAALCPPDVARLVHGMLAADPDAIAAAAAELAAAGRLTAEGFAREELACASAASGDRNRAATALDTALAGYERRGAVLDRDRALARTRALGLRRGSREAHRDTAFGWASLTATETRIAALVREGLTNREIGSRLFVSPRTVQTHVSHILQKTGLRSRVEIARFAEA